MNAVIACNLSVFTPAERTAHESVWAQLQAVVLEQHHTVESVQYRLHADYWLLAAQFVAQERRCCPFFDFKLDLQHGGEFWLSIGGPPEARALLTMLEAETV